MLYQLSYASAAQTEQVYQKRYENCKGWTLNSSTSVASMAEILSLHARPSKGLSCFQSII
jgi:hypothetical protein